MTEEQAAPFSAKTLKNYEAFYKAKVAYVMHYKCTGEDGLNMKVTFNVVAVYKGNSSKTLVHHQGQDCKSVNFDKEDHVADFKENEVYYIFSKNGHSRPHFILDGSPEYSVFMFADMEASNPNIVREIGNK